MNDVCVPQGRSEVDHDVFPQDPGERLRPNPVPEHPPGHRHHPHHDEDHGDHVIEEAAAELTETAHVVMTTLHLLSDPRHADIERDSEQEEDSNPQASGYQEPGHVRLGRTIGVGLSGGVCLKTYSINREKNMSHTYVGTLINNHQYHCNVCCVKKTIP